MAGFPTRPSRSSWGVPLIDERMREDPRDELCAEQLNLLFWQLAGLSMAAPLVVLRYRPDNGFLADELIHYGAMAWDPTEHVDESPPFSWVTVTVNAIGDYSFVFPTTANDENGDAVALAFSGAMAVCMNTVSFAVSPAICEVTVVNGYTVRVKTRGLAGLEYQSFTLVVW